MIRLRTTRTLVAAAISVATVLGGSAAAFAASGGTGANGGSLQNTEASLQNQAQVLAGQIQADGRNLEQLAESLDAAELRSQHLSGQLASLQVVMARTNARTAEARRQVRSQALRAYVAGGADDVGFVSGQAGSDPSLTLSYADIVNHEQRQVVTNYKAALTAQTSEAEEVATARHQATLAVAEILADQAAARQAAASRQQLLAGVKGQLATVVAQVQAAQQQAEQAAVQASLARTDQLPPPGPVVGVGGGASSGSPSGAAPGGSSTGGAAPAAPARRPSAPTTADPPATAPPAHSSAPTAPPRTAPPRTAPPRTAPPPTAPPRTAPPRTAPPPTAPPRTAPPTTAAPPPPAPPPSRPSGGIPAQAPGASAAIHYAYAQLGKPYQWGGAGPNSFDCSGLTMMAWDQAGIYFPHLAQDQYDLTAREPLSAIRPGDLVFFGTPNDVYHVGIYIGGGDMIDAPATGQNVSISSIYWSDLLGAGRVYSGS